MNKKLVLSGLAILILIVVGLGYRFYPYFLYKTTYSAPVQAEPMPEPTQPLKPSDYQEYLNSLDRSKLQALTSGIRVLERNISNYSVTEADESFLAFNTFYIESLNHCNETFWQNESLSVKLGSAIKGLSSVQSFEYLNKPSLQKDPEIKDLVQLISSSGLTLEVSQGCFYFSENPDFIYNHFSKYLSESLRIFLELRQQEAVEGFAGDTGLKIPFAKIGDRIINWEKYIDNYPDSPLKELANYQYQLYLGTFLFGMDNYKVFEKKHLKPEIKQVYANFKQQYSNTKSGNLISRYYEVLRSNDYKYNKAAENFLHANHVQILPGLEP